MSRSVSWARRLSSAVLLASALLAGATVGAQEGFIDLEANHDGATDTIRLFVDQHGPDLRVTSPSSGSVIAGNLVTISGTSVDRFSEDRADPSPLFGVVGYRVFDELFVEIDSGEAPIVDGRFSTPPIALGIGFHEIELEATDSAGIRGGAHLDLVTDPDAPAVSLVGIEDGQAFLEPQIDVHLNFAQPTTIVSVNAVPDGRTFEAGLALAPLSPELALGPNPFVLALESGGRGFSFSFTLHRVAERGSARIVSPPAGAFVRDELLVVNGTVPLGTPAVEVNGVLATVADDHVSFSAEIPLPRRTSILEGGELRLPTYSITATPLPFGSPATIEVTPDSFAPLIRSFSPGDGSVTTEDAVTLAGFTSESARVRLEDLDGFGDVVSAETVRDRGQEAGSLEQFHRFRLPPLAVEPGDNPLVLRATDRAGNETIQAITFVRRESALALVAPAPGVSIPALAADVTLAAVEDLTLEAWLVEGRLVPALGGRSVAAGTFTVPAVPLGPGANEVRVVYRRADDAPEVFLFSVESTATDVATVSGLVTDGRTAEPLGGALISIVAGGVTVVVTTDAEGRFEAPVAPGPVTVTAAAEGHANATIAGDAAADTDFVADVALAPTGLPAIANEVRILVPPPGAVTDWDQISVVGTVLNPAATVRVNGIVAEVVGNRFTARRVPLAMGVNALHVTAESLGLPSASAERSIERSETPVLGIELYSPPDGSTVPGGGLVVRGWVSAREAITLVADRFAAADGGLVEAHEVDVAEGSFRIHAIARVEGLDAGARDDVIVHAETNARTLSLTASPATGTIPFDTTLSMAAIRGGIDFQRLDFDTDGDQQIDILDSASADAEARYEEARPVIARVVVMLPSGVELSAATRVRGYLAPTILRTLAPGNPVDLALGPEGDLYVLDAAAGQVTRYDDTGSPVRHFGASGSGSGQLSGPQAFALAADGRVFVADTGNDRIQVFSPDGTWERSIGATGSGPGQLRSPSGVAIDEDLVVVSDRGNMRIQVFGTDGVAQGSFAGLSARGMAAIPGHGTLAALPADGILAIVGRSIVDEPPLDRLFARGVIGAPIDVAPAEDGVWLADASQRRVIALTDDLGFRREVAGLARSPLAVAASPRREVEAVFVADGVDVTEIGLPVPSPVPVVEALKDRLIAGDVEGALDLIHPQQRALFRRIYEDRGPGRASDAAAMQEFSIDRLRESRAIVRIHHTLEIGGSLVERVAPVHLVRTEDGTWQIFDY